MKKIVFTAIAALLSTLSIAHGTEKIEQIDKNFRVATIGKKQKVNFYNAFSKPCEVTGFPWWDGKNGPYRIPANFTSKEVGRGIMSLAHTSSGGAVRFVTNSPFIALRCVYKGFRDMSHMPRTGSAGFDLYSVDDKGNEVFVSSIMPPNGKPLTQLFRYRMPKSDKPRLYTIYLPLYSGVKELEIGIAPEAKLLPPPPQKIRKPIVFYGSSITQGGCASRPANNYTTMICRAVDAPQVNLGFSGSARGRTAMAEAISKLEMSLFVMDYDYNAPNAEHLLKTHEKFFQIIRKAQPDLPIIILSRCSLMQDARRDAVKRTYDNAVKAGDKKVWFIDGDELFGEAGANFCTVDRCHPNDLGFYMMFRRVLPVVKAALNFGK